MKHEEALPWLPRRRELTTSARRPPATSHCRHAHSESQSVASGTQSSPPDTTQETQLELWQRIDLKSPRIIEPPATVSDPRRPGGQVTHHLQSSQESSHAREPRSPKANVDSERE